MGRIFPIFLHLKLARCLVVGAGRVGIRRALKLTASGARVRLVDPVMKTPLPRSPRLKFIHRAYQASDLKGMDLVFACTNRPSINSAVVREARREGIWANRADGKNSDFILPAVSYRRGVTAAFSTGGGSPARSKRLRVEWDARQREGLKKN